uniref:Keratin n=1 Tax=Accipiter nisus TaxID=211598 RepID=A0A8B9RU97_9AVES
MSCEKTLCTEPCSVPPCEVTYPQPLANVCNKLCVTSCDDSRAVTYSPPIVLTFLGLILSSCPQESIMGSCGQHSIGCPFGSEGCLGYRGYRNGVGLKGSSNGYGGAYNYSRPYNSGYLSLGREVCSPYSYCQYSTYS